MRQRVVALVSGTPNSALDARAHALFDRLADRFESTIVCHQGGPVRRIQTFLTALREARPALIYLMDPIYAAVAVTQLYRVARRVPVVLDTGDLVRDLAREMGRVNRGALAIVGWAERTALKIAKRIIVRGCYHRDWLVERGHSAVDWIPDGVDLRDFFPLDAGALRARLGFDRADIVVGGVGTMNWSEPRQIVFGWELVEALSHLSHISVKGMLIGDGDGVARLRARAEELGVTDRLVFVGRTAHAELPRFICAMEMCLLTQLDSPMAWVRTTGKLPEYLACDRYVIATKVGTAARVLPPEMLLPYAGRGRDESYPLRLAEELRALVRRPDRWRVQGRSVEIAREHFDYELLAPRLAESLGRALN